MLSTGILLMASWPVVICTGNFEQQIFFPADRISDVCVPASNWIQKGIQQRLHTIQMVVYECVAKRCVCYDMVCWPRNRWNSLLSHIRIQLDTKNIKIFSTHEKNYVQTYGEISEGFVQTNLFLRISDYYFISKMFWSTKT